MDDCEYKFMPDANDIFFIKEEIEIKEELIDDYAAEMFEIDECELGNAHFLSTDDIKSEDSSMLDFTEENAKDNKDQHETQVDQELFENVKSEHQNNEKTSVEDHSTSNSSLEIIVTAGGKRFEVSLEFDADAYSDSQYKVVNKGFKCIPCGIILRDMDKARHHALVHGKKLYKCPENCRFKTRYFQKFCKHLLKHGQSKSTLEIIKTAGGKRYEIKPEFDVDAYIYCQYKKVNKGFECIQCGEKSDNIFTARSHVLKHFEKLYKCPVNCGYETNSFKRLYIHLLNHDKSKFGQEIIETAGGKRYEIRPEFDADAYSDNQYCLVNRSFRCKHCSKKSLNFQKARIHALIHSEVKLYKCPENCGFETNYFKSLRTHLLRLGNHTAVRSSDTDDSLRRLK